MVRKINLLQVGKNDLSEINNENFDITHGTYENLKDYDRLVNKKKKKFIYIFLSDEIIDDSLLKYIDSIDGFKIVYFGYANPLLKSKLEEKRSFKIDKSDINSMLGEISDYLYLGQKGFPIHFGSGTRINRNFSGSVQRDGEFSLKLEGNFGSEFSQLTSQRSYSGTVSGYKGIKTFIEYEKEGNVEIQVRIAFFSEISNEIVDEVIIEGDNLTSNFEIKLPKSFDNFQIFVYAKGKGKLELINVHIRKSRSKYGLFLPGSEWEGTSNHKGEILSYFNPGFKKGAPLIVSFTGYRQGLEGFELMNMFEATGKPRLLITDVRTNGGAFDIGDESYEQGVVDVIQRSLDRLGYESQNMIINGYSLGSYPTLYYGSIFNPQRLIVSKPILNLGTFTSKKELASSLNWPQEVRYMLTKRFDLSDNDSLNNKLWNQMEKSDWKNTEIDLFSMSRDEYDGESLQQLLDFFDSHGYSYTHIKEQGFHTQKISEMIDFIDERIN